MYKLFDDPAWQLPAAWHLATPEDVADYPELFARHPETVPAVLGPYLSGRPDREFPDMVRYQTPEAAAADLNAACLGYYRALRDGRVPRP